jgi:protein-S-isoprenylcysteine O-methyltransferase Ste14
MIKFVLIVGLFLIYGIRFRPTVVIRIFKEGLTNFFVLMIEVFAFVFALYVIIAMNITISTLSQIGVVVYALGVGITSIARLQLGFNYMPAFSASAPRKLVRTGLFKMVRNPVYLGMFVGICGFGLVVDYRLLWLSPVLFLLYKHMISKEEKILFGNHPSAWQGYIEETKFKLIPLVW